MAKYDCTKARDFLHEITRAKQCCTKTFTDDKCGDCPLAIRHFKGYDRFCLNRRHITDDSFLEMPEDNFSNMVKRLQAWSDSHPERRELTGDEAAVLVGLKLLGFKHIAADKDKMVWAYTEIPEKDVKYWTNRGVGNSICISYTGLFVGIADFSDEKPLVIDEILNERKW